MASEQTQQSFQIYNCKQMLILVRYKPANITDAENMVGGIADKAQQMSDKVDDVADAVPGLNLFLKEEKDPDKKCDKEYDYFKDYYAWDQYFNKLKNELINKLNVDNETIVFDFDASDIKAIEKEGKRLLDTIKGKVSGWKNYSACFHFVGLAQGGNVANECIKGLVDESDFKKKWWVQSVIYVATPLFKNQHNFSAGNAFRGKGKVYSFGNDFDLTQNVIAYFEPNDQLLKMIEESNSNLISVFTGKIKKQMVATLSRLLSIDGFGTGRDNERNIDKVKQCKDDIKSLVEECINAGKALIGAFPEIIQPPDLPKFNQMVNGFDSIPDSCAQRLEKFAEELKKARSGTSLDTERIGIEKIFNCLCPFVDQLTSALRLFSFREETAMQLFYKVMEKAKVKKVLAPADTSIRNLPVDPYIEKLIESAKSTKRVEGEIGFDTKNEVGKSQDGSKSDNVIDQAINMIQNARKNLNQATINGDIDLKQNEVSTETIQIIGSIIISLLLPMMPSKKKIYATVLQYIPTDGLGEFLKKIMSDAAFKPVKSLLANIKDGFDFDEGTEDEPGLKKSLRQFDEELSRVKGFFDKNNYPIHKDANSLYFIYNSHNLILKKPYGEIMNTIEKEIGYFDYMRSIGYDNYYNLDESEYRGGGKQKGNVQPAKVVKEEAAA